MSGTASDLGNFATTTIPNGSDVREALDALRAEADTTTADLTAEISGRTSADTDLRSLLGVSGTDLGNFATTTIPNGSDVRGALDALPRRVGYHRDRSPSRKTTGRATADTNLNNNLRALLGVGGSDTTLGNFATTTIPNGSDVREALNALRVKADTTTRRPDRGDLRQNLGRRRPALPARRERHRPRQLCHHHHPERQRRARGAERPARQGRHHHHRPRHRNPAAHRGRRHSGHQPASSTRSGRLGHPRWATLPPPPSRTAATCERR